ncbi:S41 family peptidase [Flavobacterium piscisymbiosum]|uniref:Tail specific protease domain-containing protein n=1 Tax=Flavobacterium piscisymbiosum TaxID=2893753 RepID=A0ABS8MF50_9FLAO|nr:S41 family peptidase [Flavobacterium sp. F-30]MCC9063586.1 hypothetical protein [Flavobacterium sp. F-30]
MAQENQPKLNMDFESIDSQGRPSDWFEWGDLQTTIDSSNKISGNNSVSIKSFESEKFGSIVYSIPNVFTGKEITLEGYIKASNVSGQVGLLLRIDKDNDAVEFNNMLSMDLKGTFEWTKYKITVPYHDDADAIYIGGLLTGKGKVWFDNFKVSVDGVNIEKLYQDTMSPALAEQDKEFDQGSNFYLNNPTILQIQNIEKLGKLWGHLKYHSASVAKGDYNFDYELIRKLHLINNPEFDSELQIWKEKLTKADQNIRAHYYLDFKKTLNPVFKNESAYSNMKYDDDGLKLIALFRYWSVIEYLFPYKNLTDLQWGDILKKYIPKFLLVDDELSYKLLLIELFKETGDSHASIYNMGEKIEHYFGENQIPITAKIINNQVIVTDFKNIPQLKTGDEILAFDGEKIDIRIARLTKYTIASNVSSQNRDVILKLFLTNKNDVEIRVRRNNKNFNIQANSTKINYFNQNKPSNVELAGDIGYIYPGSLKKNELKEILKRYKNKKGIVIDLRCYPSDYIIDIIGGLMMPEPKEFAKFSATSLKEIGQFKVKGAITVGDNNPDYYKGKVAVLIDENTQSSAEFTVMALRVLPNVAVIGSQTAGADGDVSEIILPGNASTMMSGIGIFYPDMKETQRIGMIPDIKVSPTRKGIEQNIDEVLLEALKFIKKY